MLPTDAWCNILSFERLVDDDARTTSHLMAVSGVDRCACGATRASFERLVQSHLSDSDATGTSASSTGILDLLANPQQRRTLSSKCDLLTWRSLYSLLRHQSIHAKAKATPESEATGPALPSPSLSPPFDRIYKAVLLGEPSAGKNALIRRCVHCEWIDGDPPAAAATPAPSPPLFRLAMGASHVRVRGKAFEGRINLQMWGSSGWNVGGRRGAPGSEGGSMSTLPSALLRGCNVLMMCVDVTRLSGEDMRRCERWLEGVAGHVGQGVFSPTTGSPLVVVVGCKADLLNQQDRQAMAASDSNDGNASGPSPAPPPAQPSARVSSWRSLIDGVREGCVSRGLKWGGAMVTSAKDGLNTTRLQELTACFLVEHERRSFGRLRSLVDKVIAYRTAGLPVSHATLVDEAPPPAFPPPRARPATSPTAPSQPPLLVGTCIKSNSTPECDDEQPSEVSTEMGNETETQASHLDFLSSRGEEPSEPLSPSLGPSSPCRLVASSVQPLVSLSRLSGAPTVLADPLMVYGPGCEPPRTYCCQGSQEGVASIDVEDEGHWDVGERLVVGGGRESRPMLPAGCHIQ
ncbi:unnamed protein product [Vitrella brassicaformis CCMP3155]|uniref:Uncharacterized protein n=2 Tax=Vitrella brassicaformis TaxID=1169539 RepID=A0A0G4FT52_VITBC|nr:unnamed protein product [Vitrella brassicaformis CCMP3155]|mmetsp:Transcript_28282/g.81482  ORF Transcript_28282/g.81482 Transcript_28282/m.81482 type:complete len:575 (+) Transcript_28282:339-2063(+)|eukprot:CEM17862.1 unnamed protein product [Vitrella brassicaformis CCMP3155]